ncbi:MAG: tRNA lysidine(34) synthetase TilS [Deltaproteobacteria bacterium]|nr:tRNA lysidine(34) synthetase TilS [Deltaproteobacteria bacterium]
MRAKTQPEPALPEDLARARNRTLQAVRQAVRSGELWQPGDRILLGISGGKDSIAAAVILAALRRSLGHQLVLGHVDHGLQPTSAAAAPLVAELASRLQVEFHSLQAHLPSGPDLEGRARTARYRALRQLGERCHCQRLVTAHHAQDQAETLLMRASRGAGLAALQGVRSQRDGWVVRPFLAIDRDELRDYAGDLPFWDDPSNACPDATRNAVRLQVLPVLQAAVPGAVAGLARTALNLQGASAGLDFWLQQALANQVQQLAPGVLQLPAALIPGQLDALAPLAHWIAAALALPPPSTRAVQQLQALRAKPGPGLARLSGMDVQAHRDFWTFSRRHVAQAQGAD